MPTSSELLKAKTEFITFLRENNALSYLDLFKPDRDESTPKLKKLEQAILCGGFKWSGTKQGSDFWSMLSIKWSDTCYNLNISNYPMLETLGNLKDLKDCLDESEEQGFITLHLTKDCAEKLIKLLMKDI